MAQHVMHYGDKAWTLEVADENLVAELESRTAEPSPSNRSKSSITPQGGTPKSHN